MYCHFPFYKSFIGNKSGRLSSKPRSQDIDFVALNYTDICNIWKSESMALSLAFTEFLHFSEKCNFDKLL